MPKYMNFILALLLFTATLPLMLAVAILIMLLNGWPIIFAQKRIGLYGKPFWFYKFRTMSNSQIAKEGKVELGKNATRITKLGSVLRASKLDELPQLINVLLGDIAIVGPRAQSSCWTKHFPKKWQNIQQVLPGMTDPATIKYINEESILNQQNNPDKYYLENILPNKIEIYEDYIKNKNTVTDFKIIFHTIKALICSPFKVIKN